MRSLTHARTNLLTNQPWLSLMLTLKMVESNECRLFRTDGRHLFYNPEAVKALSFNDLQFMLAHETLHTILNHWKRAGNRDHRLWNIACDYVINAMLVNANMTLPKGLLYDRYFDGMSAEDVYAILAREQQKQEQNQSQNSSENSENDDSDESNGSGESGDDETDEGTNESSSGDSSEDSGSNDPNVSDSSDSSGNENDGDGSQNSSDNQSQNSNGQSDSGTTTSGGNQPQQEPEPWQLGEVTPSQETEADQELRADELTRERNSSLLFSKLSGNLSADIERQIESDLKSRTPWQQLLRSLMTSSSKRRYSFSHPNRRYVSRGIYLPSRNEKTLGNLAIAVDTSGSVTPDELAYFSAEIQSILTILKPKKATIYMADSEIKKIIEYKGGPLNLPFVGGGGTNFCPVFEETNKKRPDLLLYLTDLYGYFPEKPPPYPVVWIVPPVQEFNPPPFGHCITLNNY